MGLFGKDRHGSMHTIIPGRQFIWKIPNIKTYEDVVLDSNIVKNFRKVNFHFHMIISKKKDIGFYLHCKGTPIPKYSYYFATSSNDSIKDTNTGHWVPPDGVSSKRVSRQYTAHTIPPDTERCGHWNVFNEQQMTDLMGTESTLLVVFEFDDDNVVLEYLENTLVKWTIPRFRSRQCTPLSSQGFGLNGALHMLRLDKKTDDCYVLFLFSRSNKLPPHSITVAAADGTVVASAEKKEDGVPQILSITSRDIMKCIDMGATLTVTLAVSKTANPLLLLNSDSISDELIGTSHEAIRTSVGSSQYVVVSGDL